MNELYFPDGWRGRPILTVDDLTSVLNIHADDIYRMACNGEIPSFKLGSRRRFRTAEIVDWVLGNAQDEEA